MIKNFLLKSKNIEHDSYLWNLIGSGLNAIQSVIMLILITRACGLTDAGIFSIAYANAMLLQNISKYGMRNFQVSDIDSFFSFKDYKTSRIITSLAMIFISLIYVLIVSGKNGYSNYKSAIIICMCFYKLLDGIEDVYHGLYQGKNRLDVASKAASLRMITSLIVFAIFIFVFKSLLIALVITTVFSAAVCFFTISITYPSFKTELIVRNESRLKKLLYTCFPLFLTAFLAFYIGNAPKYAIDRNLSDDMQACYGFIMMPVFIIELLNSFIYNPLIYKFTVTWNDKKMSSFRKLIYRQLLIIILITVLCEIIAYPIGIPFLSWLYNTDLSEYKIHFMILLLGGGAIALSGFLAIILTIMRKQMIVLINYIIVSAIAFFTSDIIISRYELKGASVLYFLLMFVLFIISIIPLYIFTRSSQKY